MTETVERVVQLHERRTGTSVALAIGQLPDDVQLPIKITVFRVIQEALANAFRHADGLGQHVRVTAMPDTLTVGISDEGQGVGGEQPVGPDNVSMPPGDDGAEHLGLAVMRERVESIGGRFSILARRGGGTVVRASLPLDRAVTDVPAL